VDGELELASAGVELPGPVMPDGPVVLGIAIFTEAGEYMGAARCDWPPEWLWRDGMLCVAYGPCQVIVRRPGRYSYGMICAVAGRVAVPLWRIGLGEPQQMRAGDDINVLDGVVAIEPTGVA
jgi:hypothetical protein